jgi:hypothetical protein
MRQRGRLLTRSSCRGDASRTGASAILWLGCLMRPRGASTRPCRGLVLVDQSTEKVSPLDVRHTVDLFDRRSTFGSQTRARSLSSTRGSLPLVAAGDRCHLAGDLAPVWARDGNMTCCSVGPAEMNRYAAPSRMAPTRCRPVVPVRVPGSPCAVRPAFTLHLN